ncbi:MAG: hypothetical protein WCG16_12875 [Methylococcales bacterium]
MSQNNSAQNSEQQIKIQKLHVLFQQLCFSYGSLALTKENVNQDQYKFFAEDCHALADIAASIHNDGGI